MFEDSYFANGFLLSAFIFTLVVFIIPLIFFFITQMNTVKMVDEENRSISPGQVWLQLIPFFGLIWQFFVVTRISDSIKRQLYSTDFSFESGETASIDLTQNRPTYQIGIAYCILVCCSAIPVLGGLASIAGIVCWIIYWVKLSEMKNKLASLKYQ